VSRTHPTDTHLKSDPNTASDVEANGLTAAATPPRSRLRAIWDGLSAALGVALGILPHLLHHIGLIAGAALVTGAGGNLLFFALGLLFSIPLLRRLHRRFHTWRAPAIAVVVFAALFSISAFVIGPAIAGNSAPAGDPISPTPRPTENHSGHHGG